jgi:hypothetical protein
MISSCKHHVLRLQVMHLCLQAINQLPAAWWLTRGMGPPSQPVADTLTNLQPVCPHPHPHKPPILPRGSY